METRREPRMRLSSASTVASRLTSGGALQAGLSRCDQGAPACTAGAPRVCPYPPVRASNFKKQETLGGNLPKGFSTAGECRVNSNLLQRLLNRSLLVVKAAGNADGRQKDDGASHEKTHEWSPLQVLSRTHHRQNTEPDGGTWATLALPFARFSVHTGTGLPARLSPPSLLCDNVSFRGARGMPV
jgi:hypothetical protein